MMTQEKKDDLFMLALAIFTVLAAAGMALYSILEKQYGIAVIPLTVILLFVMTPVVFAYHDSLEKEAKKRQEEESERNRSL